jgi:hypothetical protein
MYARQHRQPWEDSTLDTLLPRWHTGLDHAAISRAFEFVQTIDADRVIALVVENVKT